MLTLAGDGNAYEALVNRHKTKVTNTAAAITRRGYMAEDAAQDAFVTAWIKLNSLREPQKFGSWVCKIARRCAINTVNAYRSYLPIDDVELYIANDDRDADPEYAYCRAEEEKDINSAVDKLPERVGQIIRLHYFEDAPVSDIAKLLGLSVGTVKSQLHEGRKRMRKELSAMNERMNDTFIQRVMKKVEELKMWQLKNSKEGFEGVYNDILKDIDSLPESQDKHSALADVLMRGWWWLPGAKNDALFERIRNAAEKGKNDEVISFIATREFLKIPTATRLEFVRDVQIPRLEKMGMKMALEEAYTRLGSLYYDEGKIEKSDEAFENAKKNASKDSVLLGMLENRKRVLREAEQRKQENKKAYCISARGAELRNIKGNICFWGDKHFNRGWLAQYDSNVFRNASGCDGLFYDESLAVGDSIEGSGGSRLTYVSDSVSADTPMGVFENCQKWQVTKYEQYSGNSTTAVYYKKGVGIVRCEHTNYGVSQVRALKNYRVKENHSLLPLEVGNQWEYDGMLGEENADFELVYRVEYASPERKVLSCYERVSRKKYDEDSWADMMRQIRWEYCDSNDKLQDVYYPMERAAALAKSPMEKAHTESAVRVAKRILETDSTFNPNTKTTGHWNFFSRNHLRKEKGRLCCEHNSDWSFEWKNVLPGNASQVVLYNDIYGILQDAANCIWSEEWVAGASPMVEYYLWDRRNIKTKIICTDGHQVNTKAGQFENCMKLTMEIEGMDSGWEYRGGNKAYWFAPEVGIVRCENEYCDGLKKAVYELTEYRGRGKGYMPVENGLFRKYEALDTTDGYVGMAEYNYVAEEDGELFILCDRTGIRNLPDAISTYDNVKSEQEEESLWEGKKRTEARLKNGINNFNIMTHYLCRPQRNYANAERAVECGKHVLNVMETLGEGKGVPEGWLGYYGKMCFKTGCYIFGNKGDKEEGYAYLEKALEVYKEFSKIPKGSALSVGNEFVYSGIKYLKDESAILLPDGTKEAVEYGDHFKFSINFMYYALTAKSGWEWFNGVRDEERYKEFTARVKAIKDNISKQK